MRNDKTINGFPREEWKTYHDYYYKERDSRLRELYSQFTITGYDDHYNKE